MAKDGGLPHAGHLFLDLDGLPMAWHGYLLIGSQGLGLSNRQLDAVPRSPYETLILCTLILSIPSE